ncbi:MAG: B-box zinc finger protein [Chloroflexota bacterium]
MSLAPMYCTEHSGRETLLRCGKCERPFCHDCLVQTPVGLRCRACANIRPLPQYDVSLYRTALAALAGLVVAVVAGTFFFTYVGVFALWLSPFYGMAVGEVVSRASGYKSGPRLQIVAGACIVLGALLGKYGGTLYALAEAESLNGAGLRWFAQVAGRDFWLMLLVVLAIVGGISRLR